MGKGRSRQGEAERLLSGITRDGARARTERVVDAGASRRHFSAVLDANLRPHQQADLDDAENKQEEGWSSQSKFEGCGAAFIGYKF